MPALRAFVIAGSRHYPDRMQVIRELKALNLGPTDIVIAGGALGVDTWAANFASVRGARVEVMYANWTRDGRGAGIIRNRAMLTRLAKAQSLGWQCLVVCFWDRKSPGTANTIKVSQELRLDLTTVVPAA